METLIAYHCAPALAGIKPSNIFSCCKAAHPYLHRETEKLNSSLSRRGIRLEILCECEKRALIILYREDRLAAQLRSDGIKELLSGCGYPSDGGVAEMLDVLRMRLAEKEGFPHEIGAFLGYPIGDIYGFINGGICLYTGYWRVYGDVEGCMECFRRYDNCRRAVLRRLESGESLSSIFCAA